MTEPRTGPPTVSVVIPVWNVEPYLVQCLDSVIGQTIGLDRLELIGVDDGSTDRSGEILDDYAARYPGVIVVHEPNSGGAGRPRNIGLDRATGTYVFFLDADDYLGPEALERLVAMAERNTSDIVLGKMVGVEGRRRYSETGVFRRNRDRASLEHVYPSANVLKLFRRSMLDRVGLRFHEGIPGGEDGDFMARMYLEASTISVVADYDCYFVRQRVDSQTVRRDRNDDLGESLLRLEAARIMVLAAHREPGAGRDVLMRRHIKKVAQMFGGRWRSLAPEERRRVFEIGGALIGRWNTDSIQRSLPVSAATRIYCLQHGLLAELEDIVAFSPERAFGDPIVEGRRLFARFPHFRDPSGIPDGCFDMTREVVPHHTLTRAEVVAGRLELEGEAHLALVGGATTVELRRWPRGPTWRFETTVVPSPHLRDLRRSYREAGYSVAIPLESAAGGRPLPRGTWGIHLSVGTATVRRSLAISATQGGAGAAGRGLRVAPGRELRLRIGRPAVADRWLERAEAAYIRLSRRLARVLSSSRAGRFAGTTLGRLRPGMAAGPVDD